MKKEYQKPQLTKVDLKVRQTVLAECKVNPGGAGPDMPGCQAIAGGDCNSTTPGS